VSQGKHTAKAIDQIKAQRQDGIYGYQVYDLNLIAAEVAFRPPQKHAKTEDRQNI
jgi:hypothetical protein